MNNFNYDNRCKIIFGDQPESEIAAALAQCGAKKVLLVFGSDRIKKDGTFTKITKEIDAKKIKWVEYGGVVANPLLSHGLAGIELAKKESIDFILAVGGGSVIDEAKFIAVGAIPGQDAWEIYKSGGVKFPVEGKALPVGAVLTIPAAGSECSVASVIREDATGVKYSIGHEAIRPAFAYINPRYCMTLPPEQVANGASDILAHLLDRYFSPQDNVVVTDRLLEGGMRAIIEVAPSVYKCSTCTKEKCCSGHDPYPYYAEFCLIGTLAHNSMLSMGRDTQDWATHRMENKLLSGIYNIAHGAGLAILFPSWLKHVAKTKPAKIEQFAKEVMGKKTIAEGIAALQNWFKSMNLAQSLSEIGIDAEEVKAHAKKMGMVAFIPGGYGQLTLEDVIDIVDASK